MVEFTPPATLAEMHALTGLSRRIADTTPTQDDELKYSAGLNRKQRRRVQFASRKPCSPRRPKG